jgi:hypothetical protein
MSRHSEGKKGRFGTSMGVSSIIAILVILVLIVFSALSLTTARADYRLSLRTADSVTGYYAADSEAERIFARLAAAAADGEDWRQAALEEGCILVDGKDGTLVSYSVIIDENKELRVELLAMGNGITKEHWQIVHSSEWEADTGLNVIR